MVWDMGLIAQAQDANALKLFKQVLMASISIPGVFPPVLITARDKDGALRQEMHVDGGVELAFLGVPEGLARDDRPHSEWSGAHLYVVINGQIVKNTQVTPGTLSGVLTRSIELSRNAALRSDLSTQTSFARRNGVTLEIAAIPDGVKTSSLDFDQKTMQMLLNLGVARAAAGQAFETASPAPHVTITPPQAARR